MMLAHYPQPQQWSEHFPYSGLPSPSASFIPSFYTAAYSTSTPSPSEFKQRPLRNHYFDQTAPINTSEAYNFPDSHWDSSATQHLNHPPIRLQQATPSPGGFQDSVPAQMSVLSQAAVPLDVWEQYDGSQNNLNFPVGPRQHLGHRRASSSSSAGSVGPASPYSQTISYPRIAQSGTPSLSPPGFDTYEADQAATLSYTKSPPTPSHSPSQKSLLAPVYHNYNPAMHHDAASQLAAHMAKQQVLMEQHSSAEEETPAFSYSERQSVSSIGHNDPTTPRTAYTEDLDDGLNGQPTGKNEPFMVSHLMDEYLLGSYPGFQSQVPNFDRTMPAIYQDEPFNPASDSTTSAPVQPSQRTPTNNKALLSPYRTVFSERLQAANNNHLSARSQSPASTISRQRSPFREGSPYAASIDSYSGQHAVPARLGSAAQLREQQKTEAAALALAQHHAAMEDVSTPNTISPKDALLEYHESEEESNTPLFPQNHPAMQYGSAQFTGGTSSVENTVSDMDDDMTEQSYNSMTTTRRQSSSDFSTASGVLQSAPSFNFVPPSVPGGIHMPQQYPFIAQQQRRQQSLRRASDSIPEFPAHLTSMESSASDADVVDISNEIKRPTNTMADGGTYTCTYHGCTLRFETPAKLQKHKREGHRQSTPQIAVSASHVGTTGILGGGGSSGMTSAALMRNSQAGPHKCERINPSTGKACNTIFSRPYDLTRHEDTIHNARKQKVRCHLCTEEKTFSRNDALTRHMRVVHPEIDFPGKTRPRRIHD